MSQAQLAARSDRLPWLDDEQPQRTARRGRRGWIVWAALALLIVGGLSYWMGASGGQTDDSRGTPRWSGTTVPLPEPQRTEPSPEVLPAPMPQVAPAPTPTVTLPSIEKPVRRERAQPARKKRSSTHRESVAKRESAATKEADAVAKTPPAKATPAPMTAKPRLKLWPSRQTEGASGRLVQIGAFGSRQQAKLGWRRMTRAYPAVGRLPAVVVATRNSRGRLFYRFQIGTTSQAHSEVLCQRMVKIRFSCAVVGLSWKAKLKR